MESKYNYNWKMENLPEDRTGNVYVSHAGAGGSVLGWMLAGYNVVGFDESDKKLKVVTEKTLKVSQLEEIPTDLDVVDGALSVASVKEEKPFDSYFDFIERATRANPKVIMMDALESLVLSRDKGYCKLFAEALNKAEYDVQLFVLNARTMGLPLIRSRAYFIARRRDCVFPRLRLTFDGKVVSWGEASMWVDDMSETQIEDGIEIMPNHPIPDVTVGTAVKLSHEGFLLSHHADCLACGWPSDYNFGKLNAKQQKFYIWHSALPLMTANIASKMKEQWRIG